MTTKAAQISIKTPMGTMWLVASLRGLKGVYWKRQALSCPAPQRGGSRVQEELLARASRQLREYAAGRRKRFDLPLDMEGTSFQKKVWRELRRIGYGRTRSYKEVAARIGHPKAVRAVGTANGKNPLCVIVPCHRVIAADGTLGGYSAGLAIKRRLLRSEGIASPA